jgi:hypothetical protein
MTNIDRLDRDQPLSIGHNRPPCKRQEIINAFTSILLTERGPDKPCYLDAIFQKAEISIDGRQPPPDVLLADLFLFEEGRMPLHTNLFNQDLGNLTEKFLKSLFEITRGDIVDTSDAAMQSLHSEFKALQSLKQRKGTASKKPPVWKKADFLFGKNQINECKYRFNSYEAKMKQIGVGEAYQELGYTPVFLHLSPDFKHHDDFIAHGWEVYSGDDMLLYLYDHTGYDFQDILREVSAQPVVRERILNAHQEMIESQKARLWSGYKHAPKEVQKDFHERMVNSSTSVSAIAEELEGLPPPGEQTIETTLDAHGLRDRAEALCDKAQNDLPQEKRDALLGILMSLEEDQRAELLSEALTKSSDRTQMAVMSVFG